MKHKRLILIGGNGLIGRELAMPLRNLGFDVFSIARHPQQMSTGMKDVVGDVFNEEFIHDVMHEIRPTHLLNLAWCTTGDYLTSELNFKFLIAGERLAREFVSAGGMRAVYVGTCFEYELCGQRHPIKETDPIDAEKNAYTRCKNDLRIRSTRIFKEGGVSFAFARIFYVYGRGEPKNRLTGMLVDKLKCRQPVIVKSGPLLKDYIYSRDVAGALAAIAKSEVQGVVNVCTGKVISIHDFALKAAEKFGRKDLVIFEDDCANQPACILGDNTRLRTEVGYSIRWTVDQALEEIVNF